MYDTDKNTTQQWIQQYNFNWCAEAPGIYTLALSFSS